MIISSAQSEWVLSETQHKINEKKASATEESDKILNRQNFSICDATECCTTDSSDINSKRVRCLKMLNRTVLRHKFISEEEKEAWRQAE